MIYRLFILVIPTLVFTSFFLIGCLSNEESVQNDNESISFNATGLFEVPDSLPLLELKTVGTFHEVVEDVLLQLEETECEPVVPFLVGFNGKEFSSKEYIIKLHFSLIRDCQPVMKTQENHRRINILVNKQSQVLIDCNLCSQDSYSRVMRDAYQISKKGKTSPHIYTFEWDSLSSKTLLPDLISTAVSVYAEVAIDQSYSYFGKHYKELTEEEVQILAKGFPLKFHLVDRNRKPILPE